MEVWPLTANTTQDRQLEKKTKLLRAKISVLCSLHPFFIPSFVNITNATAIAIGIILKLGLVGAGYGHMQLQQFAFLEPGTREKLPKMDKTGRQPTTQGTLVAAKAGNFGSIGQFSFQKGNSTRIVA
ncbi:hypothetical protein WG66_001449 [Moniliophthora roreri]|nr:hypothetical protein WG66_001449 [Moniliophthora roreri]